MEMQMKRKHSWTRLQGESGTNWESTQETYTLPCIKLDSQWRFSVWYRELKFGVLWQPRGVGSWREGAYVYPWLLHVDVWQKHESVIGIHMSPPSWASLPPPTRSHPSRLWQSTRLSSLNHRANSHWLSISHILIYTFQCCSLSLPWAF